MNFEEMIKIVYDALDDKKAHAIKVLDIEKISTIADYFVIASASSQNQMVAMADNVDEKLTKAGCSVKSIEGAGSDTWILMDYGFCLVHIFSDEARSFYNLERMWKDAADVTETFRPIAKN